MHTNPCACVSCLAAQRVLCLRSRCWGRKFKRLLESSPVVIESSCRFPAADNLWLKCEWEKRVEARWNAAKCASCGCSCWDLLYGGVSMSISLCMSLAWALVGGAALSKTVIGSSLYYVLSLNKSMMSLITIKCSLHTENIILFEKNNHIFKMLLKKLQNTKCFNHLLASTY